MQYFVIGVLVLVVVAIAAYYILRFMKGKLELHLSRIRGTDSRECASRSKERTTRQTESVVGLR
tara:strand:+ start:151 stop:342 length:192 start_codon:yes stop_codon:yes gene_type:complete